MWSDWLVFCDYGFQSICPLMEKDKRPTEASWGARLTEGELENGIWKSMQIRESFWRAGYYNLPAHHWTEGYHFPRVAPEIMCQVPILAGVVVSFRIPGRTDGPFKRVTENNARSGLSQRHGQGVGCRQRWGGVPGPVRAGSGYWAQAWGRKSQWRTWWDGLLEKGVAGKDGCRAVS